MKAGQVGLVGGGPQSHLSEQGLTRAHVTWAGGSLAWVEAPKG